MHGILSLAVVLLIPVIPAAQDTLSEGPADGSFLLQGAACDPTAVRISDAANTSLRQRVDKHLNSATWNYANCSWGDADAGKRAWSQLLAELYKKRNNPADQQNYINTAGKEVILNQYRNTSTFFKPFSVPGYAMYYFAYKDKLPQEQKNALTSLLTTTQSRTESGVAFNETGWQQIMRADGKMDPLYQQSEFNSENFNWMARLPGFLFAEEFNANKTYFDTYVKNWTRALFNAGRVEWNSNVYFGYCLNPALVLYEYAKDPATKLRARAGLDWMATDLALHYIDCATTGPDVRAKGGSYAPLSGTAWLYGYLFFGDQPTSASDARITATLAANNQMVGFMSHSSYRPPQVLVDIAQRKFTPPVEIHIARPFYHLDYDNYADWKGATQRGRRFDFETLYLEKNYTLGSVATNRPLGVDCFWEQSTWKLAVRGTSGGAVQFFGNAGGFVNSELAAGRSPYEEIGQYRNVMMRLVKGTDNAWVGIPKTRAPVRDGNTVFVDAGNDVYAAFVPYQTSGVISRDYPQDANCTQYKWSFNSGALGAIVLEVGTREEHGSFAGFQANIKGKTSFVSPAGDQLEFTGTSGRKIRMQFIPPAAGYQYWFSEPYKPAYQKTAAPAGVAPRVWTDGKYLDFSKWQVFRVSHGERIVEENWGSGALTVAVGGKGTQIVVDPATAAVQYRKFDQMTGFGRTGWSPRAIPWARGTVEYFTPGGRRIARPSAGVRTGGGGPYVVRERRPDGRVRCRVAMEGFGNPGRAEFSH